MAATLAIAAALISGLLLYWFTGTTGLALAAGIMAVWAISRRQQWSLDGLPVVPALTYACWLGISTVLSVDVLRSLSAAVWQVALGLLAVVVVTLVRTDDDRRAVLRGLAIASLVVMTPNLLEWLAAGAPLVWRVTYDHNNGIALFNVIFILALATGEFKNKGWWPWLAAFAWLSWFSGSRGAALGLGVSVVMVGLLQFRHKLWPLAVSPLVLLGVAASGLDNGRLFSMSDRSQYWQVAVEMLQRRPVMGTGAATFNLFYNAAHPDRAIYNFNHAHSLLLNTLAEGGVVALGLMLNLLVQAVAGLLTRRGSAWAMGALAMLTGLLVHSMLDVPTSSAYVATAAVALVAVGLSTEVSLLDGG